MKTKLFSYAMCVAVVWSIGCNTHETEDFTITNAAVAQVRHDLNHVATANGLALVLVSESAQGGNDLNGDGDVADLVVHTFNPTTGVTSNLGISAKPPLRAGTRYVAWAIEEKSEGNMDFNGDGDSADHILAIFDTETPVGPGNPRVTTVEMEPQLPFEVEGDWFSFVTAELATRGVDGTLRWGTDPSVADLNGDQDEIDYVVRFFDAGNPVDATALVNSGRAFDNNYTVEVVDDDPNEYDSSIATYSVSTTGTPIETNLPKSSGQAGVSYEIFPTLTNTGLSFSPVTGGISGTPTQGDNRPHLYRVVVTGGAGGTTDVIITVNDTNGPPSWDYNESVAKYELLEDITPNFPPAVGSTGPFTITRFFPPTGPDFTTTTGLSFDTGTGVISGTPTELSPNVEWVISDSAGNSTSVVIEVEPPDQVNAVTQVLEHGRGLFVFSVNESADRVEWNLDTDARDTVLFWFDTGAPGAGTLPVGEGGLPRAISAMSEVVVAGTAAAPAIAYAFNEEAEGGFSFNVSPTFADTDSADDIFVIYQTATNNETFPDGGVAVDPTQVSGSDTRVAFVAVEAENGVGIESDFNEDGDFNDDVPHWVDLADPADALSSGIASVPEYCSLSVAAEYMVFVASEEDQGPFGTNFNAHATRVVSDEYIGLDDVDYDDGVAQFFDLSTPGIPPVNLKIATGQIVATDDFFFLLGDEASQSADLNGVNEGTQEMVPIYYRVIGNMIASDPAPLPLDGVFQREFQRGQTSYLVPTSDTIIMGLFTIQQGTDWVRVHANVNETVIANPGGVVSLTKDANNDGDFDDWFYQTSLLNFGTGRVEAKNDMGIAVGTGELIGLDNTVYTTPWVIVLQGANGSVWSYDELADGSGFNYNPASGDVDNVDFVFQGLIVP